MLNNDIFYIIALKRNLSNVSDETIILKELNSAIIHFKNMNYSDDEIVNLFKIDKIEEAQNNQETLKNNEKYIEKIKMILSISKESKK